ncbi:Oxo-4-hydroxy-4-carboxy-5-ureidoimidazoline decarboxylase [Blyttiomyces helicus]|uniref:Oxo-4-hydroxy-4-carboxy-5-ureidoimidazoline decarboxylase n=1 Tax=Blyttiomyces helicus TaxID=388810 RepID=A0A4P9WEM2_9FUNG|nr:Oxo-4-hydroxy-4-carboxy-5-ureidoimidazoline decarboxylase [Blyttiomyces helicus]|eukprot:RKO90235.1 Oxo-4-hydroxy-4-carboxy-5-ureidoimidazoline decarboxylase [Blyttiomyces helicus]
MSTPTPTLPPIAVLNTLPLPEFASAIHLLFETSPRLDAALAAARPFTSYPALIDATADILTHLSDADRVDIVNAHPRIGAPKTTLSSLSATEQSHGPAPDATIHARLSELNKQYEDNIGFRFVVFVNGRGRGEIVPVMERCIEGGSREGELERGLREMIGIARDRLARVGPVEGRI